MSHTATRLILLGCLLVTPAWAANLYVDDPGLSVHEILLYLHQILFVFWLGPDFGVYLWSGKVANEELGVPQRLAAAQIMGTIDLIPRVCMSLMLTVGGLLSEYVGITHPWWQLWGIILLGPVWLTLVILVYLRQGTPESARMNQIDTMFRWALFAGMLVSLGWSWTTGRLDPAPWIGAKLALFALIILLGLVMRSRLVPFIAGVGQLATQGASDEVNASLKASLSRTKPVVLAMWFCIALAALIGTLQPGGSGAEALALLTR